MLADSTRYPLINGNLGVFRFWVARTHIIPVVVRAEGAGKGTVDIARLSREAANVAGPLQNPAGSLALFDPRNATTSVASRRILAGLT